jgi:cytochrome c oxidase subunit I
MAIPESAAGTVARPPLLSPGASEILVEELPQRGSSWTDWVTTTDHKKIGILYLFTTAFFFLVGGVEALLMRIQLGTPDNTFLDPNTYSALFTLHGTTMIFLVVVPIAAAFGNYLVPLMIGARDMAFPRLNMLSWWLLVFGGVTLYTSLFFTAPMSGWTAYAPLSESTFLPGHGMDAWILSLHLVGLSSILGAINFIVTIHNMRAPGMSLSRMPLFVWTILIYAYLIILALSSFAATLAMLLIDRNFDGRFFDPTQGGAPLLWQHLFWFMGHPEVYIMVLPFFGMVSEIVPVFARKPIFGYRAIVIATAAIAFLGMLVWAHHMFATPLTTPVLGFFMLSSFAIAVPTGIKVFNWLATLWRGNIEFRVPLLFVSAFIAQFVIGGATGVMLAVFPVDWQLTDTYFVVAHMHYVLFGGSFFALMGGFYYWFPKMAGRMLSETWGKVSFWLMVIGFNLTFLPQHSAGLSGMPRRVFEYHATGSLHGYNLASTIGSFILALGVLVTVGNAVWSVRRGRRAGPDPWQGNTLEWFTTSPPPAHNFDVIPTVRSFEPMKDIRRRVREQEEELAAAGPEPAPEPVG